jgi:hypothetical protein
LPAPIVGDEFLLGELLLDAVGVGVGFVDLVERHNDRNARRLGVGNGFLGLRHHAVVGRHHQDDDVRALGAARAHGSETPRDRAYRGT